MTLSLVASMDDVMGVGLGLAGSAGITRVLQGCLFEVGRLDAPGVIRTALRMSCAV